MTRYYYDCPIEAAYMMKNHGFVICMGRDNAGKENIYPPDDYISFIKDYILISNSDIFDGRAYIAGWIISLLEPQVGDLFRHHKDMKPEKLVEWKGMPGIPIFWIGTETLLPVPAYSGEILQRNNKQWFTPKVEG